MCLIVLALHAHPLYPLLVAANRDEALGRPTAPAAYWPEEDGLLAGRDLERCFDATFRESGTSRFELEFPGWNGAVETRFPPF